MTERVLDELKKQEKDIVIDAYKIALIKQDIALGIVDTILEVMQMESNTKLSKEKIADKVFQEIKEISNEEIERYIKSNLKDKPKIKLKIEKRIINKIRNK
jgi:galactose-1-phosphate uridylyltransferase